MKMKTCHLLRNARNAFVFIDGFDEKFAGVT